MHGAEADDQVHVAAVVHGSFEELAGVRDSTRSLEPCARVVEVVGRREGSAEGCEAAVLSLVGDGETAAEVGTEGGGFRELLCFGEVAAGVAAEFGV